MSLVFLCFICYAACVYKKPPGRAAFFVLSGILVVRQNEADRLAAFSPAIRPVFIAKDMVRPSRSG
jgi:hypothetical protein